MGLYYLGEKNYVLAERELALAQAANPDNPKLLFQLAYAKFAQAEDVRARQGAAAAQGLYQEAINRYLGLLQRDPNSTDALYNLAYAYARLGNGAQAREYYQKTVALDPNFARAWFGLGVLQYEGGDRAGSLPHFCRFVQTATPDLKPTIDAAQKIIAENGKCK
jgi:tetratricopeptide (TPR) repeat protein